MEYRLVIPGKLPGLNDYVSAERCNKYKGAEMKANSEQTVIWAIRKHLRGVKIIKPVKIQYTWIEPNRRRDRDNIAFAKKFIQDALVRVGTLQNDGWKEIVGFSDRFEVDPMNPRIEVLIKEVND